MDLPRRDGAERFVLIASTPRSGSHMLGHMLEATREYGVPLEYLNAGNLRYWQQRFPATDLAGLFPHLVRCRSAANGTFTFKAHWTQFAPFKDRLHELTGGVGLAQALWIGRRNLLDQAISCAIARQTGEWVSGFDSGRTAFYSPDMIRQAAQEIHRSNACWRDYFRHAFAGPVLQVFYEDLLDAGTGTGEAVRTFLGGDVPLSLPARVKKQRTDRNAQWKRTFLAGLSDRDRWIVDGDVGPGTTAPDSRPRGAAAG